jgi:hypothetical protein
MYRSITLFITSLLLAATHVANAATTETLILCNDCSTSKVEQAVMWEYESSGKTKFVIKDLERGKIYRYAMWYEPEIGQAILTPQGVSTQMRTEFAKDVADYDFIRFALYEEYVSNVTFDAYDAQNLYFLDQEIINDYKENSSYARQLQAILRSVVSGLSVAGVSVGASWEFDILLPNNTIATVAFVGFRNNETKWEITEYRDSDGNVIPEPDLQNARLVFRFTTVENFARWAAYMKDQYNLDSSDIIINYNPNPPPGGSVTVTEIVDGEASVPPPPPPEEEVPEQEE